MQGLPEGLPWDNGPGRQQKNNALGLPTPCWPTGPPSLLHRHSKNRVPCFPEIVHTLVKTDKADSSQSPTELASQHLPTAGIC